MCLFLIQRAMNGMFQKDAELNSALNPNLQIVFVFQNPLQWSLEVVNERFDLPTSEDFLEILKEWVLVKKIYPYFKQLKKIS